MDFDCPTERETQREGVIQKQEAEHKSFSNC